MHATKHQERARRDPSAVYETPADLLKSPHFTPAEKLDLLRRWERDAEAIEEAQTEGMPVIGASHLAEVRAARRLLEDELEARSEPVPRPAEPPGEEPHPPEALAAMRAFVARMRAEGVEAID